MKNKSKHIILAFLILLLPAIAATRVMAQDDDSAARLPRYEIKASVDTKLKCIDASQTVTFTNNYPRPVSELYFHIYPHRKYSKKEKRGMSRYAGYFKVNPYPEGFQSGDLQVKEVLCQGKPLSFNIEGGTGPYLK